MDLVLSNPSRPRMDHHSLRMSCHPPMAVRSSRPAEKGSRLDVMGSRLGMSGSRLDVTGSRPVVKGNCPPPG